MHLSSGHVSSQWFDCISRARSGQHGACQETTSSGPLNDIYFIEFTVIWERRPFVYVLY